MLGRFLSHCPKGGPGDEAYELTYAECADFLLGRMHAQEPPFDRHEWHLATIKIPSDELDATFEFICWMNSLALFVSGIAERNSDNAGNQLAGELVEQLKSRFHDSGPTLTMFFNAILCAPPLPSDHSAFKEKAGEKWSAHTAVFGRAKAALDHVDIEKSAREAALSLLGPCMVYGTQCSITRFSTVIPKIRLVERHSDQPQAS
jgi:hypothetical protein